MVELRAELLHADASGRVVRVSAHQGERLLGSCLGEAPDAEQAEDRAAARLRTRLGLEAQGSAQRPVPAPPAAHPGGALTAAQSGASPGVTPSATSSAIALNSTAAAQAAGSPAGQPSPSAGGAVLTQAESMAEASAPLRTPGTSSSHPRAASTGSSQAGPAANDQPQAALAVTSPDQLSLSGTHERQAGAAETSASWAPPAGSPRSLARAAETSEPGERPSNASAPSTTEPALPTAEREQAEPPQATPPDPDDWSQELAGLELQLRRLAWGREQEAVFLERAFGHPSRSRLTTYGDLMAYLRALEGLETGADPASAAVPLRRRDLVRVGDELLVALGWSAEQGRRFLEEHLGQSSRQRLSDTELLEFNMLLEAELIQLEPVVAKSAPEPA